MLFSINTFVENKILKPLCINSYIPNTLYFQLSSLKHNINLIESDVKTSDLFYHLKKENDMFSYSAVEMECFALFYIAKRLNKKASAVLTVSDNIKTLEEMSSKERETTFNDAITLVLESL